MRRARIYVCIAEDAVRATDVQQQARPDTIQTSSTQAATPVWVDDLVRDNDAAIEARVQVLASAVAAESGAPQPDYALIDCLHQQIVDLRTVQGNFRQFLLGAFPSWARALALKQRCCPSVLASCRPAALRSAVCQHLAPQQDGCGCPSVAASGCSSAATGR